MKNLILSQAFVDSLLRIIFEGREVYFYWSFPAAP